VVVDGPGKAYVVAVARVVATLGLLFGLLLQVDHETSRQLVTSTEALIAVARGSPRAGVVLRDTLAKTKQHLALEIAELDLELQQLDTDVARGDRYRMRARALGSYELGEHAVGVADDCIAVVEILEWRRATYARQIVEIETLTA
jgi:hypothetical protein